MTSWLGPSSGGLSAKVHFDATMKPDDGFSGHVPGYPAEAMERVARLVREVSPRP